MKNLIKIILFIVLLSSVLLWTVGCGSDISSDKTYKSYTYDAKSDRFVKIGSSIRFSKGFKSFEYSFGDGLTISGPVDHRKNPDSYVISCNAETVALVTERYKSYLIASGATEQTIEFFEALSESFVPKAQYFAYDGKLFTSDEIELFHVAGKDSDAFEGIFYADDSDKKVRLYGGKMYAADSSGEYAVKAGYYTVGSGILTLVSTDENGRARYSDGVMIRKKYLMAKVQIPRNGDLVGTSLDEQLETSPFVKTVGENLSSYAGKTVAVLVEAFFAEKM